MGSTDDVLGEQAEYYRARAAEYDEWWDRRGRYDRGEDATARWFAERGQLFEALDRLDLSGDILELAAGTGIWTERLVRTAGSVTAVDASPEMIAINRARLDTNAAKVSFVQADLFAWEPPRRYDGVVFCFWISHVPRDRLDAFLSTVAGALDEGGRLFFVDGKRDATSTARDHELPEADTEVMTRLLNDGSAYRIVKNFWPSAELERRFRAAGLEVTVGETETYFQFGYGSRM